VSAVRIVSVGAIGETDRIEEKKSTFAGEADIRAVASGAVLGATGSASSVDDDPESWGARGHATTVVEVGGT
jgi:hypothetical protein